jgi:hypothetical protein
MPTTMSNPQTVSTIGARVRARLYVTRRYPGLDGRDGTVAGKWDDPVTKDSPDLYVAWDGLPGVATMKASHLMPADHHDPTL